MTYHALSPVSSITTHARRSTNTHQYYGLSLASPVTGGRTHILEAETAPYRVRGPWLDARRTRSTVTVVTPTQEAGNWTCSDCGSMPEVSSSMPHRRVGLAHVTAVTGLESIAVFNPQLPRTVGCHAGLAFHYHAAISPATSLATSVTRKKAYLPAEGTAPF